jgi:hypothetical protein
VRKNTGDPEIVLLNCLDKVPGTGFSNSQSDSAGG